jgi:hypothetical protein
MDDLVRGIVLHLDRSIRQLPPAQQFEAVQELRARVVERSQKTPGRLKYDRMGCEGKVRHPTEEAAEAARHQHRDGARMMAYPCGNCSCWHVGHRRRT